MIHHDLELFYGIYSIEVVSKTNALPLIDCQLFWYLFLSELNSFSIISSVTSLIMISMLSLFEWIAGYSSLSSLEEMELNFYCWLNFPCARFFEIIYDVF